MWHYTLRRTALLVPLLFGIVVVVFALMQIIPGDPAVVLLGQDATPEAVAALRTTLGLDRHRSFRLVTDPSGEGEALGAESREPPKPDTLDAASHDDT